ncbi:hypothetical protein VTH82DRAFT_4557 [Thermothelomyces myriococcoides]
MRSLRRRPFLIFDRIEAKGYKHLEKTPRVGKAAPSLRYQPGDGFSGREAKPTGSNFLAQNGKMTFTSPYIGILDLTQSEPPTTGRKRAGRRSCRDDNSFAPAPKKKARRVLAPKDSNQQAKPTTKTADPAEKSVTTTDAAATTKTEQEIVNERPGHDQASRNTIKHQSQALVTEGDQPPLCGAQGTLEGDEQVDLIVIEKRDEDAQNRPRTGITLDEAPSMDDGNSGITSVSDSPPCRLRNMARSMSPKLQLSFTSFSSGFGLSQRTLRRANTQ